MRAGKLDRRITIERLVTGTDPYGAPTETWQTLASVWAQVLQESGQEFFAADAIQAERRVVFRIRYRDDLAMTDRVTYGDWQHDIHEIRELGRRDGLELHCTARESE
ncbi:phage head closure protein [Fodinicurvata fenggangensis]|uniref:phage head closure protein n=1 Tax=Fodinicurvata fenggangensis TaxID=1121830 RepID=UPI000551936E|nr:phage head closure protein [Fodinicurvata fenggangensis]